MDNKYKIHHFGNATSNIGQARKKYESLGYVLETSGYDPVQNVDIEILLNFNERIELIQVHDTKSPINNILNKYGSNIYHVCYLTPDINESIDFFRNQGFILIGKVEEAVVFENRNICFMYDKDIGLIELLEE